MDWKDELSDLLLEQFQVTTSNAILNEIKRIVVDDIFKKYHRATLLLQCANHAMTGLIVKYGNSEGITYMAFEQAHAMMAEFDKLH